MEAIAAFGLACNVIQVVDFGLKIASKFREIYDEGRTIEHQDLDYTSKHLAEINEKLSASIQNARTNKPLTKDDHELQDLAVKCARSARDLRDELDKLKISGRHGKRAAVFKAFKSIRRNDAINKIRDRLCEYERVLDTRMLPRLNERVDLLALQQDASFKGLDQTLQAFVNNLANGTAGTSIKPHEKTFRWIFGRTEKGVRPWDNFVEWLEKGGGICWINGKAGSGKSTLMNYVATDPRTMDSLTVWSQSSPVLTLTFFFWNAGANLQKSALGLLRSLLYQILDNHQEIIPELAKSQGTANLDDRMPVWTRKRLESSLKFVIDKISQPVCFFIDGLDEFDEGEEDPLELISALQSRPSVKICLSSRPLQCFINVFEHSAQLKLQDLTRRDIEIYVEDRLYTDPRMEQLLREDSWRGEHLIGDVVAKAEGIFLWVRLAVKLLLQGLTNKDDWETMGKRLLLLPKGIESLCIHMWSRLGEDQKRYREEAALYSRIILREKMSLLGLSIATNENLQSVSLDLISTPPGTDEIDSMCKDAEVRILTRCAGLLEVDHFDEDEADEDGPDEDGPDEDGPDQNEADEDPRLIHLDKQTRVRFIHRTARDFLVETREGQVILGENTPPPSRLYALLLKSKLGLDRLLPKTLSAGLPPLLNGPRETQIGTDDALEPLMDIIESYFSTKYSGVSTRPNWLGGYNSSFGRGMLDEGPATEFLGLAAAYGLYLDKSKRFLQHPQRTDPRFTNYLLSCAVYQQMKPQSVRWELVLMLLSNGADPNTTIQLDRFLKDGTPISCWSSSLFCIWAGRWHFWDIISPSTTVDLYELIEAFLNNDVDLHVKLRFGLSTNFYIPPTSWEWESATKHSHLVCELSTRYIVTELVRHNPQFSKIEKRFEAAGAQTSRKVLLAHQKGSFYSQPISEKDSQYLLEALDEYESERLASAVVKLWNRIGEVSSRDPDTE